MPAVANSNVRQTNGGWEQRHRENGNQTIHYEPAFRRDSALGLEGIKKQCNSPHHGCQFRPSACYAV
jgi:hypothetical protein